MLHARQLVRWLMPPTFVSEKIVLNKISSGFFKKWVNPASFSFYFRSFQTNIITIFTTIICKKCPSSIQCWDWNPQSLERESIPITTRPGLLLKRCYFRYEHDNIKQFSSTHKMLENIGRGVNNDST